MRGGPLAQRQKEPNARISGGFPGRERDSERISPKSVLFSLLSGSQSGETKSKGEGRVNKREDRPPRKGGYGMWVGGGEAWRTAGGPASDQRRATWSVRISLELAGQRRGTGGGSSAKGSGGKKRHRRAWETGSRKRARKKFVCCSSGEASHRAKT